MPQKPEYLCQEFRIKDLRRLIMPNPKRNHTFDSGSKFLTRGAAKLILDELDLNKKMYHRTRNLVWLTEEWCQINNLPYEVEVNGDRSVLVTIKEQQ